MGNATFLAPETAYRAISPTDQISVAINAAFLQEIKEVNVRLAQALEEARQIFSGEISLRKTNCRQVVDALRRLLDELTSHFSLEEFYGYFEGALSSAPWLTNRAVALRSEHAMLLDRIAQIVDSAESLLIRGRLATFATCIPRSFVEFDAQLNSHEAAENQLILEAFDDDIGIGD